MKDASSQGFYRPENPLME